MSCTVIAIPYALAWVVGAISTSATVVGINEFHKNYTRDNFEIENCNDINIISAKEIIQKVFETPFVDKMLLLKTLEEHGVKNIKENDNNIVGNIESYSLTFTKEDNEKTYKLLITCLNDDNPQNKFDDLEEEYAVNVQEDAYNHIIERLNDNNMQIENEEIQDDNTIVITINID